MTSYRYFHVRKGSLVEVYLKQIIVGINEQIEKKNHLHFTAKFFKTNLTYIIETAKLQ